jgi:lysophospholipase L1-like esterase
MPAMTSRSSSPLWVLALAVSLVVAACGEDSTTIPSFPSSQLTIVCPSPKTAVSIRSQPTTITWTAPTTSGGTAPVSTTCTPASGSAFGVGTTIVGCTATGSGANESASCTFTVTVARPPQMSVARFMAFGDSITWGTAAPVAGYLPYKDPPPLYSYPSQLLAILGDRYPDQSISMANEGWPGESINTGLARLPDALAFNSPEVLLLLDGANDLLGSPSSATTQYIAGKLREMVKTARAKVPTVTVLLATFPPQWHGTTPYDRGAGAEYVPGLNAQIVAVASSEGATLVDLYTPMSADIKKYIGADGLHPTEAGFTLIAQTFYAAIKDRFEVKTTARR